MYSPTVVYSSNLQHLFVTQPTPSEADSGASW